MKNKKKFSISYQSVDDKNVITGYFEKVYLNENETGHDLIMKIEKCIRSSKFPTTYYITEIPI